MDTYKITFETTHGTLDSTYTSFESPEEAGSWAGRAAKERKDFKTYSVEKLFISVGGYLEWLHKRQGAVDALQQIAQMLYFDGGEYDEGKDVSGGDMVEVVADQLNIHALTVEAYLKDRDIPVVERAEPESEEAEDTQCETIAKQWAGMPEQDRREQMEALRNSSPTLYSIAVGKLSELQASAGKETLSKDIRDQLEVIYVGLLELHVAQQEKGIHSSDTTTQGCLEMLRHLTLEILKPHVKNHAYVLEVVNSLVPGIHRKALFDLARTAISKTSKAQKP